MASAKAAHAAALAESALAFEERAAESMESLRVEHHASGETRRTEVLAEMERHAATAQAQLHDLEVRHATQLEQTRSEVSELESASEASVQELALQLDALRADHSAGSESSHTAHAKALQQQRDAHRATVEHMSEASEDRERFASSQISKLRSRLASAKENSAALQTSGDAARAEAQRITKRLEALVATSGTEERELASRAATKTLENASLTQRLAQALESAQLARSEHVALSSKMHVIEAHAKQLDEERVALQGRVKREEAALREALDTHTAETASLEAQWASVHAKEVSATSKDTVAIETLQREVHAALAQRDDAERALDHAAGEEALAEVHVSELQQQLAHAHDAAQISTQVLEAQHTAALMHVRNEHRIATTTAMVTSARQIAGMEHEAQISAQGRYRTELAQARGAESVIGKRQANAIEAQARALKASETERLAALAELAATRESSDALQTELRTVEDGKAAWMARLISSCSEDRGMDSPIKATANGFRSMLAGAHPPIALERAEERNAELQEQVHGLEQSLVQTKMELAMLKAQVDGF